jgi:hypothetical protein
MPRRKIKVGHTDQQALPEKDSKFDLFRPIAYVHPDILNDGIIIDQA